MKCNHITYTLRWQVVLANPKTAGVARWIFLALWGSQRRGRWRKHIRDTEALEYVRAVFSNVVVQPRDAREASDVFYKQRVRALANED
jgi:sulfate transport system substrate-binding protein